MMVDPVLLITLSCKDEGVSNGHKKEEKVIE
jgi:hypothetical protein